MQNKSIRGATDGRPFACLSFTGTDEFNRLHKNIDFKRKGEME